MHKFLILNLAAIAGLLFSMFFTLPTNAAEYWTVTHYYTPVPGQHWYYNGFRGAYGDCHLKNLYYAAYHGKRHGTFEADACMQGDFTTADGTDLHKAKPFTVAACPKGMIGKVIHVDGIDTMTCHDVGGAIGSHHVDVWTGFGDAGYEALNDSPGGQISVQVLPR